MSGRSRQVRARPLALAYVRVSTTEQADDGASLAAQRGILAAECERRGWDADFVSDEGYSAATVAGRPGLSDALDRLDRGDADVLLAQRVDRLSRSVADFAQLMARAHQRRWQLVALDLGVDTSTPAGDLMANVLASVAQYERKIIGQRTREGMAQRRAEGVHIGRRGELPVELVWEVVQLQDMHSANAIARMLNERGEPTARGGASWYPSTIRRLLQGEQARQVRLERGRAAREFEDEVARIGHDAAYAVREARVLKHNEHIAREAKRRATSAGSSGS